MKVLLFLKKILCLVVNAVLFIIVAISLLLTLPKGFGINPYVVMSGSMEPYMKTGGIVFTDTNKRDPNSGDVITFKFDDGSLTSHRVTDIKNGKYVTKGDANDYTDAGAIDKNQIVGTVIFTLPFIGYALEFAKHKGFFFILAALVILSFALDSKKQSVPKKATA